MASKDKYKSLLERYKQALIKNPKLNLSAYCRLNGQADYFSSAAVHPFVESCQEHFGHPVLRVEFQRLVEAVEGLAIVSRSILLWVGHDERCVVEAVERGEVRAVGGFGGLQRFDALDHALCLVDILLCLAGLRLRTDCTEQEHRLLVFRLDAVGLHGFQALQRGELLLHRGLALLGMETEEGNNDDDEDHHAAAGDEGQCLRNLRCHKLYYF